MKYSALYLILIAAIGVQFPAQAAVSPVVSSVLNTDNTGTKINITATIIAPPPCKVNAGRDIEVDFGQIGINKIDGVNFKKKIDYNVTCEIVHDSRQLKLKVTGTAANFDTKLLNTTVTGLGIRLESSPSQQIEVNKAIDVTLNKLPELYAIPIKNASAVLSEGDFTSSATLQVDYL